MQASKSNASIQIEWKFDLFAVSTFFLRSGFFPFVLLAFVQPCFRWTVQQFNVKSIWSAKLISDLFVSNFQSNCTEIIWWIFIYYIFGGYHLGIRQKYILQMHINDNERRRSHHRSCASANIDQTDQTNHQLSDCRYLDDAERRWYCWKAEKQTEMSWKVMWFVCARDWKRVVFDDADWTHIVVVQM